MHLRNVELTDLDAYVQMRCDPVMMAELGGPLPREGIAEKVRKDVEFARRDLRRPDHPRQPLDDRPRRPVQGPRRVTARMSAARAMLVG